jgi:dienelactone hydrolase
MLGMMTRRALGLAAVAAGAMAQKSDPGAYTGALDGFESKVDTGEFDPVKWSRKRWESAPLRMTYRPGTRKQTEEWQKKLRAKITDLLGGFPERGPAPKAEILEVREFPNYKREKFVFETRPGVMLLGYVLSPKTSGPHPAMVCVPGHGRGVDDIVGIDEKGRDRTGKPGYQHDFAIQAAEHGMAAVAIEPMAFGCRRDPLNKAKKLDQNACQPAAGAALLFGETMIGWRVFDVMRTIDWIETRRDMDAKRLGCMGISGGGTCTLFSAALDTRIQAAFVSGYLNVFRDCILSLSHCMDNYVPGILNWAEMYDVASLIAPRVLFAESGDRDRIFPATAAAESFAKVKKVYEVFDAAANTDHEIFSGTHSFNGGRGLDFVAKKLGA